MGKQNDPIPFIMQPETMYSDPTPARAPESTQTEAAVRKLLDLTKPEQPVKGQVILTQPKGEPNKFALNNL
jgi:hypothetical protein